MCNGTHNKKALLSDTQLFDDQFEELLTELTERDLTDPVLGDALRRLREVLRPLAVLFICICSLKPVYRTNSYSLSFLSPRFWSTMHLEVRGTGACL